MNLQQFYVKLGKRIKELREEKGYSQQIFAEKADISIDYLGKIEVNINNPVLKSLFKIVRALDISFEEFFKSI